MGELRLVLASASASVYSFAEKISSKSEDSVLLIDFECEYSPGPLPQSLRIDVLHTAELSSCYSHRIIIVNRVTSLVESSTGMQRRLNLLYELVYMGKTVYMVSEYLFYGHQKAIPYMEYIERMADIEDVIYI